MKARTTLRAAYLPCRTSKWRPSSPSNPSGRKQATLSRSWLQVCYSNNAGEQTVGCIRRMENPELPGAAETRPFFREGYPGD